MSKPDSLTSAPVAIPSAIMNDNQLHYDNPVTPKIEFPAVVDHQTNLPAGTPVSEMGIAERLAEANRRLAQLEDDLALGRDVRELVVGLKTLLTI